MFICSGEKGRLVEGFCSACWLMLLRFAFFFCVNKRIRQRLQIGMTNLCLLTRELLGRAFHFRPCFCGSVSAVKLYKVF